MKLTKLQLKLLKFYAKYETTPLTPVSIIRPFWIQWVFLLLVGAAGCLYLWAGWPVAGWLFVGVSIGALLRDANRILSLFRTWPALHQIINWQRLKELLQNE